MLKVKKKFNYKSLVTLTLGGVLLMGASIPINEMTKTSEEKAKNDERLTNIQKTYVSVDNDLANANIDANMQRRIDFTGLRNLNPDITAWLYLPNSSAIDSYVMQEKQVGKYKYERHDINGKYSVGGEFFKPALPVNTGDMGYDMILGHKMDYFYGEWKFNSLASRYSNLANAKKNEYVYVYTPDKSYRYKVFSAKNTLVSDGLYEMPKKLGSAEYQNVIDGFKNHGLFTNGDVNKNDKMLILSTCGANAGSDNDRFAVAYVLDATYDYKTGVYSTVSEDNKFKVWLNDNMKRQNEYNINVEKAIKEKEAKVKAEAERKKKEAEKKDTVKSEKAEPKKAESKSTESKPTESKKPEVKKPEVKKPQNNTTTTTTTTVTEDKGDTEWLIQ